MTKGLVYVFTGEGKGKTSAALGVTLRSLLLSKQVVWIAFYKQESWGLAEAKLSDSFQNLEMMFGGEGFRISGEGRKIARVGNKGNVVVDTASEEEHVAAATNCLQYAVRTVQEKKPFLLVLDEVLNAVSDGLVSEEKVRQLLESRGDTHIVLTGRHDPSSRMWQGILNVADLVTECRKIKHPYDKGKLAVAGLDF